MAVSIEYVSHVPTVLDGRGDGTRQRQSGFSNRCALPA
jgi:hypothetical protein